MDKPQQKRSVLRSLADALRGIWCSVKSERNMRIHLTVTSYVLFTMFSIDLAPLEKAVLVLAISAVISVEMLNTAIEKHCDFNQKNYSGPIRNIKDIAAGAVLITAISAVVVGVLILWRRSFWQFLLSFVQIPQNGLLLLFTLIAAFFFIFWGPVKIAETFHRLFGPQD